MKKLQMPKNLAPFILEILLFESVEEKLHQLPFYADGFPGIIYSKSNQHFFLQPRNKELSDFYMYGQTIVPISLDVIGAYELICMRMYPFTARMLMQVDPKALNDDCYDLKLVKGIDTQATLDQLRQLQDHDQMVDILATYFNELLQNASLNPDYRIKLATNLILKANGIISIKALREKLCVTERTLERKFLQEIGVTPKQFAKIIQFSASMKQITESDYARLTEIGYDNGFADQSHFIRSFKKYTGKTPKEFKKQLAL